MADIDIKSFVPLEKVIKDPSSLLRTVAAFIQARARRSFREQRRGNFKWRARSVPSVAGALSDVINGERIKPHRFDPRPALVDSGELRRSVNARENISPSGKRSIVMGSPLKYASVHQLGGESVIRIPADVREKLKDEKFYQRLTSEQAQEIRGKLARVAKNTRLRTRVPARPFFLVTDQDKKDLTEELGRILRSGGTGS